MEDMDYLKKLQEAMMGQPSEREEYVTDPALGGELPEKELKQVNQEATSAYLKESPERSPASDIQPEAPKEDINELRRAQQQFETDRSRKELSDIDPKVEYAKLIEQYKAKLAEPDKKKETGVMDWISSAGQIADVFNKNRGFAPQNVPIWKDDTVDKSKAKKKEELTGMQQLQSMYQKYMSMNKGDAMSPFQKESLRLKAKELDIKDKKGENKEVAKTKLQEEREKNIADRYDSLQEQIPNRMASIEEARALKELLEKGEISTGPGAKLAGDIGSFIGTKESTYKQRLDSLAEKAARAQLKANGEVRPTDADVEGMKRAMFNLGNTEEANIKKLEDFIKQQEAGIDEYNQMKKKLKSGEGLENFILENTYKKEESSGPYGKTVERNGKKYIWNPSANKYQLM